MKLITRTILTIILAIGAIIGLQSFQEKELSYFEYNSSSYCYQTPEGPVIDWDNDLKLKQSDFKATSKGTPGFAVATTASAFGFSIVDEDGEISGNIYVRFYCDRSWWNPDYKNSEILDDVLKHEQLHFDICELYGRKLYKEIIILRNSGRLNNKHINRLYTKIEKQYSDFQDKYDEETNHSINRKEQSKWNKRIKIELAQLSIYSDYRSF
ncbi:MAG: DUF922 domain-containing protein [Bacteroidetes bacterium]|nr:DUF922 domain-containing protein [Bacteroidota bacterium]